GSGVGAGDAVAGRVFGSPRGLEPLEGSEEVGGAVDAQGGERARAEMVDIDVLRHQQAVARPKSPHRQVVVLEEAGAEALVEAAQAVEYLAAGQQAEARQPFHRQRLAGELPRPPGGEG